MDKNIKNLIVERQNLIDKICFEIITLKREYNE